MGSRRRVGARSLAAILAGAALLLLARPEPEFFWPGFGLSLSGALLRLWACGHLYKNKELATSGPYARLKHPLYLGTLLGVLGLLAAVSGTRPPGSILALAGFPLFLGFFFGYYYPRKRRIEADRLRRRFGAEFEAWDRAVPGLWPRLLPYQGGSGRAFAWQGLRRNSELGMFLVFLAGWSLLCLRMLEVLP